MREQEIVLPRPPRLGVRLPELPAEDGHERGLLTYLKPSCGRTLRLAREWDADKSRADLLWDIAETLLPDLTRDQIEQLTVETVLAVMDVANQPPRAPTPPRRKGRAPRGTV
jgi:hypothetical protein